VKLTFAVLVTASVGILSALGSGLCVQAPPVADPLGQAAAAYQSGDMRNAIRLYREFLRDHPDAAEIRSNLGAALVRDGQFGAALDEYRSALQAMPGNIRVRTNLALALYKLGRLPEAIDQLQVLHRSQPIEPKPALLLADCWLQTGEPQKAADLLAPFEQEYPEDHAITYLYGMALLQAKHNEQAQFVLDRILREGESAESAYLLGQSEYLNNNRVAAASHLARAVQLNPKLPGLHSLYGQVLRGNAQLDEATAQFRQELELNPYDFAANVEMSLLAKQDGQLDQALLLIGRALQVRPDDPAALYQRASIYFAQDRLEPSREEFERLLEKYPNYPEAHAALARVYYRLKRQSDGDRESATARRLQEEAQKQLETAERQRLERLSKSSGKQ
jgi:tetratricopeptide (TPR) repeat protein